ncbi:MAG: YicC family protein [Bacteroidales bacterium]|nr:YicC family protein [Bacteroidales bacterium]
MIKSMTGFGKHVEELPNQKITFEIKSLNSKQLDLTLRIPNQFREKELELRAVLSPLLQRGKAEGILTFQAEQGANSSTINKSILKQYLSELKNISEEQNLQSDVLRIAMKMPDVLNSETPEIDEKIWASVMNTVMKAVVKFDEFRLHEGQILEEDFRTRIITIQSLLKKVETFEQSRISTIKERIKTNLEKWLEPSAIDKNRFEQELFYYLEKIDLTEEKLRLEKHCLYFLDTLNEESAGKKLGFVTQEIGREINTIGSKANDVNIQKTVVEMKDELEKIKEQLMNVL